MKTENVTILGTNIPLTPLEKKETMGLTVGIVVNFYLYRGNFHNEDLCFYQSKTEKEYTPSVYAYYTQKISSVLNMPAILITNKRDYNNRMRLVEQGVYFVASSKFAYLPNLIANTHPSNVRIKKIKRLSPKAQFLLLYWMQSSDLDSDVTISTFTDKWNFSYISISRALAELERFGLCDSQKGKDNIKTYHFKKDKKNTWNDNQGILHNPISKIVFMDQPVPGKHRITNISALSHYSLLNPDRTDSIAVSDSEYRQAVWKDLTNEIEGKHRIEIWDYTPDMFDNECYVDRLSLVLSLRDNHDARVEGEVERVINEMKW